MRGEIEAKTQQIKGREAKQKLLFGSSLELTACAYLVFARVISTVKLKQ